MWVFISDNGGGTGEHRLTGKQCPYLECHRVPFIMVCPTGICPGAASGTRDATNYALNIDIAPTIVDLADATATIRMDGRSLVPILSNPTTPWRTEWGLYDLDAPIDGVVAKASTGQWYKYLVGRDTGHVQLYNLTTDPWELTNLWNNAAYTAIQADMAAKLANFLSNPTLTITQQPPSSGAGSSATFAYSSNETVTFECSLDGGATVRMRHRDHRRHHLHRPVRRNPHSEDPGRRRLRQRRHPSRPSPSPSPAEAGVTPRRRPHRPGWPPPA